MLLLLFFEGTEDDVGQLTLEILREIDTLRVFLDQAGVEPTNNRAERALRCAVQWRKCSNGTQSEKVTAGWSGCCPSGRPVDCANRQPSRFWWIP